MSLMGFVSRRGRKGIASRMIRNTITAVSMKMRSVPLVRAEMADRRIEAMTMHMGFMSESYAATATASRFSP